MKKFLRTLSLISAAALVFTGCTGKGTSTTGGTAQTSNKPFIYVAQQVVGSIDPAIGIDETELVSIINMYDPLFYPERTNGSMNPVPRLAKSYEVSADGKKYTIELRDDITFHSGNKLTAKDVVYTLKRELALKRGNSWLWDGLFADGAVKATGDDTTVEFNLNKPYAPFIASLTQLFIVDSQLLEKNTVNNDYGKKFLESNDAGSGPYSLGTWNRESEINFKAFDKYFLGWSGNHVKNAQMKFITEEATAKTLLISAQADLVHEYLNTTAYEEFKKQSSLTVKEDPSAMIQEMPMNTQKAPTDDINVRKAIATIFDYATANKDINMGAVQARGPVPNMVKGNSTTLAMYSRNVEKAKEYLAKSKYAGQKLEVTYQYVGGDATERQLGQLLTQNLAEIGITVKVIAATWPQITESVTKPETTANLTMLYDTLKYPHLDSHTYGKYHPSAHGNYRSAAWLDNADVTKTLEAARASITEDEQLKLYGKAQDLITELCPSIYIADTTHRIAYQKNVKGYEFVPLMGYDIAFYYFSK
ncbi:MAG: ABC transporter substrate-binding protein [Clostridiaceae bacterium]